MPFMHGKEINIDQFWIVLSEMGRVDNDNLVNCSYLLSQK